MQTQQRRADLSAFVSILILSLILVVAPLSQTAMAQISGGDAGSNPSPGMWVPLVSGTSSLLWDVHGSASFALTVGMNGTFLVYDGSQWDLVFTPSTLPLYGVWGSAPDEVFLVGASGRTFFFDGEVVTQLPFVTGVALRAVWGTAPDDVFAVGDNGTTLRFDGERWNLVLSGTASRLLDVYGLAGGPVIAVGNAGTILRLAGDAWELEPTPTTANLFGIWVRSQDDAFAVGNGGTVFRYDGNTWQIMETPTTANLLAVWGVSDSQVYAVGDNGTLLSFDGTKWSLSHLGTTASLKGIHNGFVVGANGTIRLNDTLIPTVTPFFAAVSATVAQNDVALTWRVRDESPKGGFMVYRQIDGLPETIVAGPLAPDARQLQDDGLVSGHTYRYTIGALVGDGEEVKSQVAAVRIDAIPAPPPEISRVFPNPFALSTTLDFSLPQADLITVSVYDVQGKQVTTLAAKSFPSGAHSISWNGRDANGRRVSAGTYFFKLHTGDTAIARKVVLVR